jgi:hypothetical protein
LIRNVNINICKSQNTFQNQVLKIRLFIGNRCPKCSAKVENATALRYFIVVSATAFRRQQTIPGRSSTVGRVTDGVTSAKCCTECAGDGRNGLPWKRNENKNTYAPTLSGVFTGPGRTFEELISVPVPLCSHFFAQHINITCAHFITIKVASFATADEIVKRFRVMRRRALSAVRSPGL